MLTRSQSVNEGLSMRASHNQEVENNVEEGVAFSESDVLLSVKLDHMYDLFKEINAHILLSRMEMREQLEQTMGKVSIVQKMLVKHGEQIESIKNRIDEIHPVSSSVISEKVGKSSADRSNRNLISDLENRMTSNEKETKDLRGVMVALGKELKMVSLLLQNNTNKEEKNKTIGEGSYVLSSHTQGQMSILTPSRSHSRGFDNHTAHSSGDFPQYLGTTHARGEAVSEHLMSHSRGQENTEQLHSWELDSRRLGQGQQNSERPNISYYRQSHAQRPDTVYKRDHGLSYSQFQGNYDGLHYHPHSQQEGVSSTRAHSNDTKGTEWYKENVKGLKSY